MTYLAVLALAPLWLLAASVAGATLLRPFRVEFRGSLEVGLLSLMLGFPLASYATFAFGAAGWLTTATAWVVFGILVLVGLPTWSRIRPGAARGWLARQWDAVPGVSLRNWAVLALLVVLVVAASLNLIGSLAPPTDADSLNQHLSAPAYFVRQGEITFVPYRDWPNPSTAEMWNVLSLLLGHERLALVFQWSMGLASAAALYMLASARTSPRAGLLAATIYYTAPHVLSLSVSAKSDLAWLTFVFLSLHCLLAWRERRSLGWLLLAAVATGLALSTKYQGLFWLPAIGLVLVALQWPDWRRAPWTAAGRSLSFGLVALLVGSPWWIRNWIAGGDPIWPYGYPLLGSSDWSQELHDKYTAWTQGPGDSIWYFLAGPWNLTVNQSEWLFGLKFPISPLLLAFVPALLLVWPRTPVATRKFFAFTLLGVLIYYTIWFHTYQQTRYLLPALALLTIPAAYCFWELTTFRASRLAAGGLLALSLAMFLGYNVIFNAQFVPVVFGAESRDEFLASKVGFYDDIQWVNRELPEDARLLFYHIKTYYLDRDFVRGDRNLWPIDDSTTADDYLGLLERREITHIFVPGNALEGTELLPTERVLGELKETGNLVSVYFNPEGISVESRTLEVSRLVPVEVLEVVYPVTVTKQR